MPNAKASMITRAARIVALLLALSAIVLTVGPQTVRPYTGIDHDLEHAAAFALVGLVLGLGFPNHRLIVAALAVAAVTLMELVQLWVPGRHGYFRDVVINGLGACAGIAAAAAFDAVKRRWHARDVQ